MNWKKGITRLYCVGWVLWLLAIGTKTALVMAAHGNLGMGLGVFAWLGLVLPGALLIGLRWALDGFSDGSAGG